jgi:hypothetical protein
MQPPKVAVKNVAAADGPVADGHLRYFTTGKQSDVTTNSGCGCFVLVLASLPFQ